MKGRGFYELVKGRGFHGSKVGDFVNLSLDFSWIKRLDFLRVFRYSYGLKVVDFSGNFMVQKT